MKKETALTFLNLTFMRTSLKWIGYRKKMRLEWITENTLKAIEAKSPRLNERISNEHREKDKKVQTWAWILKQLVVTTLLYINQYIVK